MTQSTIQFGVDCPRVFDLVADIERYPEFLPGWCSVEVRQRTERTIAVHQVVQVAGFRVAFDSTATLERPRRIVIVADKGMFEHFEIDWHFERGTAGCRVTLQTRIAMRNRFFHAVLTPIIARQHREIIRCFEQEAKRRHRSS